MIVGGNCSLREIQIFQRKNNAITAVPTANEALDLLLEPDYLFEEDTGEYRLCLQLGQRRRIGKQTVTTKKTSMRKM